MAKLILTRGVPASGKTTWAKAWLAESPETRLRANRDDIRAMLGFEGIGTPEQERNVTEIQKKIVEQASSLGYDVVLDDTNLRAKFVKDWLKIAGRLGMQVEFKDFQVSYNEALIRDYKRHDAGERYVGEAVIKGIFERFSINKQTGILPAVPTIDLPPVALPFKPYVWSEGLHNAIIVDIDGTLAHMEGRSPYDPTLYHTDSYDEIIGRIVDLYHYSTGAHVILLSGRSSDHRGETLRWLGKHATFPWQALYMRASGDTRNDAIVKDELFEAHIAGKYNVDFILDDRNRVVEMWRAKGLKVLQVAEGAF